MEPPAGPCSSPPGHRPVPPPRRGSTDRRPLSPVRRDGKPGTPERATVTQRVVIVLQSRESAPTPSLGAAAPEDTPRPSLGASLAESTPTPSLGAAGSTPTPNLGAAGSTPTPSLGAAGSTPTPNLGAAGSTPTPNLGAAGSTPTPSLGASLAESTPTPSLGAAGSTPTPSLGASPPEDTPIPSLRAAECTPIPSLRAAESTPRPSLGASLPEDTPTPSLGTAEITPRPSLWASLAEDTPIPSLVASLPEDTRISSLEAAESAPIWSMGVTLPEYTPLQSLGQAESATGPSLGVSLSGDKSVPSLGMSPLVQSHGTSPPIKNQVVSPAKNPAYTVTQDCTSSSLESQMHLHSILPQKAMIHIHRMSPQKSVMQNHGASPQKPVMQNHGSAPPEPVMQSLAETATQRQGATLSTHIHLISQQESEIQSSATAVPHQNNTAQNALLSVYMTGIILPDSVMQNAANLPPEGPTQSAIAFPSEDQTQIGAILPLESITQSATALPPAGTMKTATVLPHEGATDLRPEDVIDSVSSLPPEGVLQRVTALSPEEVLQRVTSPPKRVLIQQNVVVKQDGDNVTQSELNSVSQTIEQPSTQSAQGGSSLSPIRVHDSFSPHRNMYSKPPLPIPPRSNLYPGHPPPLREQETSLGHETASLSSYRSKAPAPDTLSYLDSVSLMSGTLESLTMLDDASSLGSDSEINGIPYRKTDKYGFLGGNQFSGNGEGMVSLEIARQRELKWLDMFNHWDKWIIRRFQKVKLRCRKGIPSSLRAKAWQCLSSSDELLKNNPGKFEEMERQPGDPKWLDVIEKDLHRQFPFHEMFAARGGHGQQDLYRILKAYTVYRPEEGYCQAQAPVAAVLLMHMPAEQAFWCLVQICDKYLPGYYSAGLEAIQLDGEIFFALLRRVCPMAYRHLKKFKIDPILYMTEWFMCIFSRTLPWASVLRVWDMFFCEGVKIIFRVGLVLLRHTLGSVDKLRSCQGMYETMEKLRSLPVHCMQEEVLLPEVSSLPVTDALIERESNTQLRKWRENRGELQYRPSRRMHGARQIYEEKLRLNPALSGSRLSLSSLRRPSPPPMPALAIQPESVVVSEGLHPALPSPTSNKAPLGPPKEAAKKGKEKPKEKDKKREKEEREREKKREKEEREEREREQKREREREKQREKEEKRVQKEKEKQKRERKFSFRRKEVSSPGAEPHRKSEAGSAAHDTYF